MDAAALIVAALAGGAAAGTQDTTSEAINDAYLALKTSVKRRLAGHPAGEAALEQHEVKRESWGLALTAELYSAGAGRDAEIVEAARYLAELLESSELTESKYVVSVLRSQGVLIGDRGWQKNVFHCGVRTAEDD